MAMAHLQRAGHKPIVIISGGTTMIGDPTGKTQMRSMLSEAQITDNGKSLASPLKLSILLMAGRHLKPYSERYTMAAA